MIKKVLPPFFTILGIRNQAVRGGFTFITRQETFNGGVEFNDDENDDW